MNQKRDWLERSAGPVNLFAVLAILYFTLRAYIPFLLAVGGWR